MVDSSAQTTLVGVNCERLRRQFMLERMDFEEEEEEEEPKRVKSQRGRRGNRKVASQKRPMDEQHLISKGEQGLTVRDGDWVHSEPGRRTYRGSEDGWRVEDEMRKRGMSRRDNRRTIIGKGETANRLTAERLEEVRATGVGAQPAFRPLVKYTFTVTKDEELTSYSSSEERVVFPVFTVDGREYERWRSSARARPAFAYEPASIVEDENN
jgi:hypothetical protein